MANRHHVLLKYRGVDATFRERLKNGKVYICECHFLPEVIVFTSLRSICCFHLGLKKYPRNISE